MVVPTRVTTMVTACAVNGREGISVPRATSPQSGPAKKPAMMYAT